MATNGMTINGLNPLSALTADDKIPVWDTGASGEPTKEITAQNMANSVKSLASLPNTTEMNAAIEQSTANAEANFRRFDLTSAATYTITVPSSMVFLMIVGAASAARQFCGRVLTSGAGTIVIDSILPQGDGLTIDTSTPNKIKLTITSAASLYVTLIGIRGDLRNITY